ncbi:asparaginase [Jiulongibacter sediminis]|jgi:L-asparaginase|uniref:asparaginase n=1 Tax=Jiulongibacter sediminis TaxID=1605367 RepID=UPI0026F02205|nr:asparaginase [Jiulongibacter sediminis]
MGHKEYHIENISGLATAKILVIYTGGTLGMIYDQEDHTLVPMNFEQLSRHIPELNRVQAEITVIPIEPPIDSSDMRPEIWLELASLIEQKYDEYDGFVILHGTDTMAYTASALSFLFENLGKPVIFTGAQLSLGVARTDARENMITAIELAADQTDNQPILHEVCIYFNGRLLRGNRAKKKESSQFDAFQSENYPMLAEVGVYCEYNYPYLFQKPSGPFTVYHQLDTGVLIIKLFPGLSNEMLAEMLKIKELKAIILETYGSGNASSNEGFLRVLKATSNDGIIILNVSQCQGGSVRQQDYATGLGLQNIGVISGKDLTTEAALTKLMFLLGQNLPKAEIESLLQKNLRGEMAD